MSVENEILRIQHNIANAYAAVSGRGGEVPLQPTSANLAAAVESIPEGAAYTAGDGIDITETEAGASIGVTTPVRNVLTQAEYDALPEAEQNKGLYVISDSGGGASGGMSQEEADARYLKLTGGTVTGPLSVQTPTASTHAATKQYVDDKAGEIYSTEETRVGTWIDGKPVYRRVAVVSGVTVSTSAWTNFFTIPDFSQMVNWRVIAQKGGNQNYLPDGNTQCSITDDGVFRMVHSDAWFSSGVVFTCIAEYTKTTD